MRDYLASQPDTVEKVIHLLLDAAEHERSGSHTAGNDWFASSLNSVDEVATELELTIVDADNP